VTRCSTLHADVYFDLICPWCLIGKRQLDAAIRMLRARHPQLGISLSWHSCVLIPGLPRQGVPYRDFYLRRLGSPAAVANRQAQVREAARAAGVQIEFERMEVFPNALDAHRLVASAQLERGASTAEAVIDALFTRYFTLGQNIGDAAVLREVAAEFDIAAPHASQPDPVTPAGVHGVPCYRFNGGAAIEGAQPPAVLLEAMLHAIA